MREVECLGFLSGQDEVRPDPAEVPAAGDALLAANLPGAAGLLRTVGIAEARRQREKTSRTSRVSPRLRRLNSCPVAAC